ncbi:hypothetical protein TDB9533_03536 [Thalassocella blandensis]|nr:hypothetical protein TDB9533_03536 [Thalassocella blandensis]
MSIYLEYEGIKGNVTAEGYKDQILVTDLQFSVGRAISMEPGNCANREATRASVSELTFSHPADTSAVSLFTEAVKGAVGKKATFTIVQVAGDKLVPYMIYTLEDCLVSSYSISAHADGNPIETCALSFTKMEVKYIDHDGKNKVGAQQVSIYDIALAK